MFVNEYKMVVKGIDTITVDLVDSLLETILDLTKHNLRATSASVWQATEIRNGTLLDVRQHVGRDDRPRLVIRPRTKSVLAWAVRKCKPLWLVDIKDRTTGQVVNRAIDQTIDAGELWPQDEEDIGPFNEDVSELAPSTNAVIVVPIVYRQKLRGLIVAEASGQREFSIADVQTLTDLGQPTGILLWKLDSHEHNSEQTKEAISSFKRSVDPTTARLNPYQTGFIARPFEDPFNPVAERLSAVFSAEQIRATEYRHPPGGGIVVEEMMNQIAAAHFGVVDLTGLNDNVLVELGILMGLSKPLVIMRNKADDAELPFNISGYHVYGYALDKQNLRFWEPGQANPRPASQVVSDFIAEKLANDEAFNNARKWESGPEQR